MDPTGTWGALSESTTGEGPNDTSTTTDDTVESTGTSTSEGVSTTSGDSTTGDATTGAPMECAPPDATTTGGDPVEPIASWQAYALAECTAYVECGCVAPKDLGVGLAGCLTTREAELGALAEQGLTWDPTCAALRVAALVDACGGGDEFFACEHAECALFHGTGGFGEKCEMAHGSTSWADGTTCAADQRCNGWCVPRCSDVYPCGGLFCPEGTHCEDHDDIGLMCVSDIDEGDDCHPVHTPCADGFLCTADAPEVYTCKVAAGACEPCGTCEPGLHCDEAAQVCVPRRPEGEPCATDDACATYVCGPGGLCGPPPGLGEACPHGLCAAGLACGKGAMCVPAAQRGEPCKQFDNCEPGLLCFFEGYCEQIVCGDA